MKKAGTIVGVIAVIIIIVVVLTCDGIVPRDSTFDIKISGTGGLEFSGSYMVTTSNGQVVSKSVDGMIPEQYSVSGTLVSVMFQKQTEEGTLRVEIVKGNEVIASEETTAEYGIVSVATD
ncbi:MAG: hypothetical protein WBH01_02180 [Dehalococcoidia bacterium]